MAQHFKGNWFACNCLLIKSQSIFTPQWWDSLCNKSFFTPRTLGAGPYVWRMMAVSAPPDATEDACKPFSQQERRFCGTDSGGSGSSSGGRLRRLLLVGLGIWCPAPHVTVSLCNTLNPQLLPKCNSQDLLLTVLKWQNLTLDTWAMEAVGGKLS